MLQRTKHTDSSGVSCVPVSGIVHVGFEDGVSGLELHISVGLSVLVHPRGESGLVLILRVGGDEHQAQEQQDSSLHDVLC